MAEIYEIIDQLLEERGISGAKMCADLGMSRSFLTELRKGRAKGITMETAQKIADYFDVSVYRLLGKDDPSEQVALLTARIQELTDRLQKARLTPQRQHALRLSSPRRRRLEHSMNTVRLLSRDGSIEERDLSDEQMAAIRGILLQMPLQLIL